MKKEPNSTELPNGPFEAFIDAPSPPVDAELSRNLDCYHYDSCLNIAVALNWDDFYCTGCVGEINQSLQWLAGHNTRRDSFLRALCPKSGIALISCDEAPESLKQQNQNLKKSTGKL